MSDTLNCIFCKISQKQIPSQILFENSELIAFKDIQPQAPHHFLVTPKKHFLNVLEITQDTAMLLSNMILIATQLTKEQGFSENGFRLVFNCNKDGGQSVDHLHLHVLGGRTLKWPPG